MYRYLTNEAVILMYRIVAELSFFCFPVLCFVVASATEYCGIQRTTLVQATGVALSVVIPVYLVYAGTMVDASTLHVHASTKIILFESLTFERSFQPLCYLSHVV